MHELMYTVQDRQAEMFVLSYKRHRPKQVLAHHIRKVDWCYVLFAVLHMVRNDLCLVLKRVVLLLTKPETSSFATCCTLHCIQGRFATIFVPPQPFRA